MKWLRFFLLLGVVVAVGCSPPSGTEGDANDPALTTDLIPVDEAAEAAAAGAATEAAAGTPTEAAGTSTEAAGTSTEE